MKRKNSIKMDKITIIRYALTAVFFLVGVILILCEDNSDFLSSLWGMYFSISFIFIAFLCFIFIRREQLDLVFIIYLVLFGVYLAYLMPIFGYRTSFLIFIIFSVIGLSISFLPRLILKREIFKSSHSYIEVPAYILIIILISFISEISFVSSFPFILPSLIIAVIALVISIVYHVKLKQTNMFKQMKQLIADYDDTAKGENFTDLRVIDVQGKEGWLSDYIQPGKYNLFEVWGVYCGHCRMEIPHLNIVHENYGDKLNIIALCWDEAKYEEDWKKALGEDKPCYLQLRQVDDVQKIYHLSHVPYSLIIDGDGKIVTERAKGAELDLLLEQHFGQEGY